MSGDASALASLVRKSLVQFEREPRPGRYRQLETVRVFALEQLGEAGEAEAIGRAHAEWMAGLVDHPIEEWHTDGAIDHRVIRLELDNWREAVNFAVTTDDADLALRLSVHTLAADHPETGRWSASASTIDGIADLPGAHWLFYTLVLWTAPALDYDALERHIEAFEQRCTDPSDRTFIAPFRAMLESMKGETSSRSSSAPSRSRTCRRSPTPICTSTDRCTGTYRRPPTWTRLATRWRRCATARFLGLPVALAFLAISLRDDDPEGAMEALSQAEEHAERLGDPFQIASVAAWGSLVTLALPTPAAAAHLEARLDRLQSYYGNAEVALLTLCMCVLRRVDSPAAAGTARVPLRDAGRRGRRTRDRSGSPRPRADQEPTAGFRERRRSGARRPRRACRRGSRGWLTGGAQSVTCDRAPTGSPSPRGCGWRRPRRGPARFG